MHTPVIKLQYAEQVLGGMPGTNASRKQELMARVLDRDNFTDAHHP